MEERRGGWIQTFSGRAYYPLDPRSEDVDIRDIAHSLALQCRYGGHCLWPFSVAQHCVLVSYACDLGDALWGLLHDAAEAYLVDVPRPIKGSLLGYRGIECGNMLVICKRFGLPFDEPESVRRADKVLLATEARDLMADPPQPWEPLPPPLPDRIEVWPWDVAKAEFLQRFYELTAVA